jgi:hypothetical protein
MVTSCVLFEVRTEYFRFHDNVRPKSILDRSKTASEVRIHKLKI